MTDKVCYIAAALALAFAIGYVCATVNLTPSCPQEDSCRADYHDGAWHIIPLSPEDI